MMKARTSLWASMAIAASVGLAGCGGSSDNDETDPPGSTTTPTPVDITANVPLTTAQHAALLVALNEAGETATLNNVGEGDTIANPGVTRAGVTFTCVSAYPCTVTLENSADTIVATVHTQHLPGTTVSGAAAGLRPDAVDAFARLNDGSATRVRSQLTGTATHDGRPTEIIGMGIGGPGVLPEDAEDDAGMRSDFQANGDELAEDDDLDGDPLTIQIALPGNSVNLEDGTTITGGGDAFNASNSDIAPAPDGWEMRTLFRDWGDTAGDGDGGFETGAIVVTNLGNGTPHPFDRALHDEFVNPAAQRMFDLTVSASGGNVLPSLATSVNINPAGATTLDLQWEEMEFDTASLVPAQDLDLNVNPGETFTGTYFDAKGQFRCVGANDSDNCALARKKKDGKVIENGPVVVADFDAGTSGFQNGRWTFTPDNGAMVTVPDQDWMVYGAWLTTPDASAGNHRFGVVFNGLDAYGFAPDALTPTTNNALRGSAAYEGGATGVYVDATESGLFTADATLTAHFDKDSTGTASTGDNTISGRIDNFRGTDGIYLGSDTSYDPNDPDKGGENDWVVLLGATGFDTTNRTGVIERSGSASSVDPDGITSGSADGVSWSGTWNGYFFGPNGTTANPKKPSGVAGRFSATTGTTATGTSVVGAFGAN